MKLFNKKGDLGQTSLLYGLRVPKSDPRPEAYGTLDEANSTLGFAKAISKNPEVKEIILQVQNNIFVVGAELATDQKAHSKLQKKIGDNDIQKIEDLIDTLEDKVKLPDEFIIPGESLGSASLDMARTIIRRAERQTVRLKDDDLLNNDKLLAYLNRLADLLFILARYEASLNGTDR